MLPRRAFLSGYPSRAMGGYALKRGAVMFASRSPSDVAIAVGATAWTALVVGAFFGWLPIHYAAALALLLLPLLLAARLVFGRTPQRPAIRALALWSGIVGGALIASIFIDILPVIALAAPGILVSALVCARYPAAAVVGTFALTGTFNTIAAYTPFPVGESVDVALAGLWVGALWTHFLTRRERPLWIWPGVVLSVLYIGLSAAAILGAETLFTGLYAFRISSWYMLAFVLVGYAGWKPATYRRIAHGVLAVALFVGAYATLRWIIGPADAERQLALVSGPYNFINGELRLFGSLPSGHHLSAWTAVVVPFCLGYALAGRETRWRIVAGIAAALCSLALFGSEVRVGAVAAIVGSGLVILLYQSSRSIKGLHLGTTAVAVAGAIVIGAVLFSLSAGHSDAGLERYSVLLSDPTSDHSYKARIFKWETALDDIEQHPFGQGLGTAGEAHLRYGRFVTVASLNIDSSYLKVALDQGFAVTVLFMAAILALMVGLARRTAFSGNRAGASLALGACGSLAALSVLLPIGTYMEGLPALTAWLLVGLGVSHFTAPMERHGSTSTG